MSTFTASARLTAIGTGLPEVEQAGRRVDDKPSAGQVHLNGNRRHEGYEHFSPP
jgi:hypothetical protein